MIEQDMIIKTPKYISDSKDIFFGTKQDFFEIVKSMNTIVKNLNDETAYYNDWIEIVPDDADDLDFHDIADNDELFQDAVATFCRIVEEYIK